MEFKSSYQRLIERLEKENKIKDLSSEESFNRIAALNAKMAAGEADLKQKELEAQQELSSVLLNA